MSIFNLKNFIVWTITYRITLPAKQHIMQLFFKYFPNLATWILHFPVVSSTSPVSLSVGMLSGSRSTYFHLFGDLFHFHNLDLSPECQTYIFPCPLDVSICMLKRNLSHMFKWDFLILLLKSDLSLQSILHLGNGIFILPAVLSK